MASDKITIMVIDDDSGIRGYISNLLTQKGYVVVPCANGAEAIERLRSGNDDVSLALLDILMPEMDGLDTLSEIKRMYKDMPVVMLSALGHTNIIVKAMKAGATDYLVKPFEEEELELAIKKALEKSELLAEISTLKRKLEANEQKGEFIYSSSKMQKIKDVIEQVADTDASVLIEGESGTGKELVARALHYRSSLSEKPFVKVNCAALPRELLESELFGYERGAFTGAYKAKAGKFELANNGTMFLDEISEIDPSIQAKLLQVLQEGSFSRLGGKQDIRVNVRIIAATNRNLREEVEAGRFRGDIYYRLNVVNIHIPPLRERPEDIPYLFEYFLEIYNAKYGKQIKVKKDKIYPLIMNYHWPGNVRELKNMVKRAVILGNIDDLHNYLGFALHKAKPKKEENKKRQVEKAVEEHPDHVDVDEVEVGPLKKIAKEATLKAESQAILKALQKTNWNKKKAAQLLEISYKALLYKIKECGIDR